MWHPHPRKSGGLSTAIRRAYQDLIRPGDPAATWRVDSEDLRPESGPGPIGRRVIVSGPKDLMELRTVMEGITGRDTWPFTTAESVEGRTRLVSTVELDHHSAVLRFVAALAGRVEDRTRAWRTWRTVVESVGAILPTPFHLTVDAVLVSGELAD